MVVLARWQHQLAENKLVMPLFSRNSQPIVTLPEVDVCEYSDNAPPLPLAFLELLVL